MSILIEVSQAEVDCLLDHLPADSDLSETLRHSGTIPSSVGLPFGDNTNLIECDEGEARALLRIVTDHCPEAIRKIQYGMGVAGVRYS
jgi:hypothetical protein